MSAYSAKIYFAGNRKMKDLPDIDTGGTIPVEMLDGISIDVNCNIVEYPSDLQTPGAESRAVLSFKTINGFDVQPVLAKINAEDGSVLIMLARSPV